MSNFLAQLIKQTFIFDPLKVLDQNHVSNRLKSVKTEDDSSTFSPQYDDAQKIQYRSNFVIYFALKFKVHYSAFR